MIFIFKVTRAVSISIRWMYESMMYDFCNMQLCDTCGSFYCKSETESKSDFTVCWLIKNTVLQINLKKHIYISHWYSNFNPFLQNHKRKTRLNMSVLTVICTDSWPSPASLASMVNSTGKLAERPVVRPGPLARTLLASWVGWTRSLNGLKEIFGGLMMTTVW